MISRVIALFAALAFVQLATAQTDAADVAALAPLQACISQNAQAFTFVQGWNLSSSQTPSAPGADEVTAQLAAAGVPGLGSPPPGGAAGGSDPCGGAGNPVPWTGLLCEGGRVTQLLISQLATTRNLPCDVSTLGPLSGLSAVQRVDFTNAGLTGSLPADWSSGFEELVQLTLAQNDIEGTLPAEWGSGFPKLDTLRLEQNQISGPLPTEWGTEEAFPELLNLVLGDNQISGGLPPWEGGFQKAQLFGLSNNQLDGVLPDVWSFPALRVLELYGNDFTGCLPESWQLPNLTSLSVQNNSLSGQIPDNYASWDTLTTISITPGNSFCGAIPPEFAATPDGEGRRFQPEPAEPNAQGGFDLPACDGTACPAYAFSPSAAPSEEAEAPAVSSAGRRLLIN